MVASRDWLDQRKLRRSRQNLFGAPDIKGNPLAPYINGTLLNTSAHAEQYFNPPGNHPSQPNYLWLEAGTNFGVLADTQPGQPQLTTDQHLVRLLENAGISWKAYAEPDFGSPVFDVCPLTFFDVEHLAFVYFNDVNDNLNPQSAECIAPDRAGALKRRGGGFDESVDLLPAENVQTDVDDETAHSGQDRPIRWV